MTYLVAEVPCLIFKYKHVLTLLLKGYFSILDLITRVRDAWVDLFDLIAFEVASKEGLLKIDELVKLLNVEFLVIKKRKDIVRNRL